MLLPQAEGSPRRLRFFDPVNVKDDACLSARRPGMVCDVCADACPAHVITAAENGVSLNADGCLGCGRCASACPTGAIAVDGFEPSAPVPGSIVFECRRVPESAAVEGAGRVPCLGGLTANRLLQLCADGAREITLVDRGACTDCLAGGVAAPWAHAVEDACTTLDRVRSGMGARVRVEARPLPTHVLLPLVPERSGPRIARRALFERFVGATRAEQDAGERRALAAIHTLPNASRGTVVPVARQERLAAVATLAAMADAAMPTQVFPAIAAAGSCGLHGICAAICPTGALRLVHEDDIGSFSFDSAACIACGECERVCPESALSLSPTGDGRIASGRVAIAQRVLRACDQCGSLFAANGAEENCRACVKDRSLMQTVFALIQSRRPASDENHESTMRHGDAAWMRGHGG